MSKIVIITDSTSDISDEVLAKENIKFVPLRVHFGDKEEFLDRIELSPKDFYKKIASSDIMPHTSQPSPHDFVEAYKDAAKPEDTIISIHIASKLSGTCQSALMAKEMLPDYNIEVVDSKTTSMGLGVIVIQAAQAANSGKNKAEIMDIVNYCIDNSKVYFTLDTLEYLQKNGRIGKAQALLGGLLKVKPILTFDKEGAVHPLGKVRGRGKAIDKMISLAEEGAAQKSNVVLAVVDAVCPGDAEIVKGKAKERFGFENLYASSVGSVIGAHGGPGTLVLICCPVKG